MLLDAKLWAEIEIQDGGRQQSWIFENLILSNRSLWAVDFSSYSAKFGAKC